MAGPLLDGRANSSPTQQFYGQGDTRVLGWVKEAIEEGDRINRSDPAFEKGDSIISYIMGEQLDKKRPTYLPSIVINKLKKMIRSHVSVLTDVRPLFAYKSFNPAFKDQGDLLNRNTIIWWVNTCADQELADCVKYSAALGTGDCVVEWDPEYNRFGDTHLFPRDPRDTLPIRPGRSRSIQTWQGVVIREAHSPNAMRAVYPDSAFLFNSERSIASKMSQVYTRFRKIVSPAKQTNVHEQLAAQYTVQDTLSEIPLFKVYMTDNSINTTGHKIIMGKPGTSQQYSVEPGQRLYPRKRLIVCTEHGVLYDGPSPYWHGMFPISRLRLDPWPWSFFGVPLANDLLPMSDGLNSIVNDFVQVFSQWVNRGAIADKNAIPEGLFKRFDPRFPNWKIRLNPTYGDGFKLAEGPQLPPWSMEFLQWFDQKYDDQGGVQNLQAMLSLRQMPSADTIQKYWEAMTPELRLEGREIELFLRDLAEMVKCNQFQYYTSKRRQMLLGDAGITLPDYDYDPGNMVPAMSAGDEGYVEELDKDVDRDVRAQYFMKLFPFYVAPNSMLAMTSQERRMEALQLSRMGYLDFWSLMETIDWPNVGQPPSIMVPDPTQTTIDPVTGAQVPVMVPKVPSTITERLQAQQQMGIGMTESPAGRKASGQAPPQLERKSDGAGGERITMTES